MTYIEKQATWPKRDEKSASKISITSNASISWPWTPCLGWCSCCQKPPHRPQFLPGTRRMTQIIESDNTNDTKHKRKRLKAHFPGGLHGWSLNLCLACRQSTLGFLSLVQGHRFRSHNGSSPRSEQVFYRGLTTLAHKSVNHAHHRKPTHLNK